MRIIDDFAEPSNASLELFPFARGFRGAWKQGRFNSEILGGHYTRHFGVECNNFRMRQTQT